MKFNPLSDRVVLEPVESDEVTSGGIIIPDTAKEKPQEGKVVAVGPGKTTDDGQSIIAPSVSVGDRVVYSKYAGTEVKQDGKEYVIVREADVLAVLK